MNRPDFWENSRWNNPNQPVVGVTWYEAEAFCRWLSARFEQLYRLPTEEEWEHMARGKHGRVYPWGNEWIEDACNTSELNLQQTSAVGIFPQGVSPSGAHDCAGNVWEWCNDDGAALLLCGGSYMFAKDSARLWARHYFNPPYGNFDYGFRVVAPIS